MAQNLLICVLSGPSHQRIAWSRALTDNRGFHLYRTFQSHLHLQRWLDGTEDQGGASRDVHPLAHTPSLIRTPFLRTHIKVPKALPFAALRWLFLLHLRHLPSPKHISNKEHVSFPPRPHAWHEFTSGDMFMKTICKVYVANILIHKHNHLFGEWGANRFP